MFISVGLFKIHFVGCSLSFFNLRTHVPEIFLNYLFKIYPSFPLFFLWNSSYSDVGPPYTFITLYFLITFSLLFSISVLWETLFSKPYWNIHFCYLTFYFQEFFFCCWMFLFKKKNCYFPISCHSCSTLFLWGYREFVFVFLASAWSVSRKLLLFVPLASPFLDRGFPQTQMILDGCLICKDGTP